MLKLAGYRDFNSPDDMVKNKIMYSHAQMVLDVKKDRLMQYTELTDEYVESKQNNNEEEESDANDYDASILAEEERMKKESMFNVENTLSANLSGWRLKEVKSEQFFFFNWAAVVL